MFINIHLLSITVFLTFMTAVKCGTSRDPAYRTSSTSKLLRGLKRSLTSFNNENLNVSPRRSVASRNEVRANFENVKKNQMENYVKMYNDLNNTFLPYNALKCPPCVCTNISSNSVSVLCDSVPFTSIPQNWSFEVSEIILNRCERLEVLDLSTLLTYTSLTRLKVSPKSLVKVHSSNHLNVSSNLIELDLTFNSITAIDNKRFILFPHLQVLSLRSNRITKLTKEMFTGLFSLRSLSVSFNRIEFIANDTFNGFGNLTFLDISYNEIIPIGHGLLPGRIFKALSNLEQLYINSLCINMPHQCSTYTNKALQFLTNLKLLRIDSNDRRGLGPEVKNLEQLRTLIILIIRVYDFAHDSYFDNVPFINTLVLSAISAHKWHPKSLSRLTKLINFTYSSSNFENNICHILSDTQYLLNSSLKYLSLQGVNDLKCGCKVLKDKDAKYLTLFKLLELDLSYNGLFYLSSGFLEKLPASLQKIDLSGNSFSSNIISRFKYFPPEILELNLNNQMYDYYECKDDENVCQQKVAENTRNQSKCLILLEAESKSSFKKGESNYKYKNKTTEFLDNVIPSKLRILRGNNFRHFGYNALTFSFSYLSIKELSLAAGDNTFWNGSELGSSVEILDFNHNYADFCNPNIIPENSSLRYLSISNNLFGNAFQFDPNRLFFANTKQLIVLDMSRNFITDLAHDYFRNLFKLEILDISNNKLQFINISFSNMNELRFLDFSKNSITSVSKASRDDLDLIATDHGVYIDLTSNPLPCTCEGLELMKWMAFTNVYILSRDFLVCKNEFNEVREIGNIVQRVETLQRQCASKTVIILTCVFSIIGFGILLVISLMYRYRWKLRYLRNIALGRLLGSRSTATNNIEYRFDAYILYTDDTRRFVLRDCVRELEEKRGHRLCIEERDFLPGTYIVSNIVSGVQNSTKTVAMVTPDFYDGEYSEYSVKMALMEEICMRRSVLFLCVCVNQPMTRIYHMTYLSL